MTNASGIHREPIFWLTTSENAKAQRERTRKVNGRLITEKVPQHGHHGDYESKTKAKGVRYINVVRHEGHVVSMCLTNAAAHLDASGPYANYIRSKARHLGWYPAGACPAALFASGELRDDDVVSDEVKHGKPCASDAGHNQHRPCKHDLAERAARTKLWNEIQAERMASFKTDAEKHAAELRQIHGEFAGNIAKAVAEILAQAKLEQETPPPLKETKKAVVEEPAKK